MYTYGCRDLGNKTVLKLMIFAKLIINTKICAATTEQKNTHKRASPKVETVAHVLSTPIDTKSPTIATAHITIREVICIFKQN